MSVVTTSSSSSKTNKIPNTKPLVDKIELSFKLQKKSILSKFDINFDYYLIEKVRIGYIFNLTKGKAKDYLELYYKSNNINKQKTTKEKIDYLVSIYIDLFKV